MRKRVSQVRNGALELDTSIYFIHVIYNTSFSGKYLGVFLMGLNIIHCKLF